MCWSGLKYLEEFPIWRIFRTGAEGKISTRIGSEICTLEHAFWSWIYYVIWKLNGNFNVTDEILCVSGVNLFDSGNCTIRHPMMTHNNDREWTNLQRPSLRHQGWGDRGAPRPGNFLMWFSCPEKFLQKREKILRKGESSAFRNPNAYVFLSDK